MYYVYLKDEVATTKGFSETTHHDGSESHKMRLRLGCIGLNQQQNGRWMCYLGLNTKEVPPELAELVEEISFMTDIPASPHRERGVYRHESARAQVTASSGKIGSKVHITGKNLADVRELHHKILAGSVRPEESYEGEQNGMSRRKLEVELARLRVLELESKKLVADLFRLVVKLREESHRRWPFCTKDGMADRILKILYADNA